MTDAWQAGQEVEGPGAAYELVRPLGEGGFGSAWLAKRASDGLHVAIKALHIHRLKDWKSLELFERECAVLRRLEHPQIPNYIDDFRLGPDPEQPDGLVLVQEYVDGRSLAETMRSDAPTDTAEMVAWMAEILGVLDYLHRLSPPVVHRDVKPGNILIDPGNTLIDNDQRAWLVDFGTVQAAVASAEEASSTSAGTFGYAPMEQFVGAAFPSSDLYGLAMTCLAVASKKDPADMPFSGVRVDVRSLVSFDARLTLLLERMTEPDPERRLPSARLALDHLRPLVHRYATREGVSVAAMQAVAHNHAASQQAAGRAKMSGEDLLPSEQIREAGHRMAQLDGRALAIPVFSEQVRGVDHSAVSPSGELIGAHRFVLDANDYSEIGRLHKDHISAAFDATGQVVLAVDDDGAHHARQWRRAEDGRRERGVDFVRWRDRRGVRRQGRAPARARGRPAATRQQGVRTHAQVMETRGVQPGRSVARGRQLHR